MPLAVSFVPLVARLGRLERDERILVIQGANARKRKGSMINCIIVPKLSRLGSTRKQTKRPLACFAASISVAWKFH